MNVKKEAKWLLTHDEVKIYHANGNIKTLHWAENGVADGPYKMWAPQGTLIIDSYCIKGVLMNGDN